MIYIFHTLYKREKYISKSSMIHNKTQTIPGKVKSTHFEVTSNANYSQKRVLHDILGTSIELFGKEIYRIRVKK